MHYTPEEEDRIRAEIDAAKAERSSASAPSEIACQPRSLALAPCWPSGAFERNQLVGETLKLEPITQCWIGCDGRKLLRTCWDEHQQAQAEAMARMINTYDKIWEDTLADCPSIKPEMRGKLVVIVDRWHLRYSDTPGGGWEVCEWLRRFGHVRVESVHDQWQVSFDDGHPHHGRCSEYAPTMAEAACLVALRFSAANNDSAAR